MSETAKRDDSESVFGVSTEVREGAGNRSIAHGAGAVDEGLAGQFDIAGFIYALGFNWAFNRGVQGGHWERIAQRFSFDLPSVSYGKFFSGGHYPSSYKLSFI